MKVAVFGLGEAGSLISADLAAAGVEARGYDPADVADPEGVQPDRSSCRRRCSDWPDRRSGRHAERRLHEMQAAADLLTELCIEPLLARATVGNLQSVPEQGIPKLPSVTLNNG